MQRILHRIELTDAVPERTTQKLKLGTLKDENGVVIPSGSMAALVVTLYNESDAALINPSGRPAGQSIKNENGGSADGSDSWSLVFQADDLAILDQKNLEELHVLLVEWYYSVAGVGRVEIAHHVRNLAYVA